MVTLISVCAIGLFIGHPERVNMRPDIVLELFLVSVCSNIVNVFYETA
jgi:hypothetical protein